LNPTNANNPSTPELHTSTPVPAQSPSLPTQPKLAGARGPTQAKGRRAAVANRAPHSSQQQLQSPIAEAVIETVRSTSHLAPVETSPMSPLSRFPTLHPTARQSSVHAPDLTAPVNPPNPSAPARISPDSITQDPSPPQSVHGPPPLPASAAPGDPAINPLTSPRMGRSHTSPTPTDLQVSLAAASSALPNPRPTSISSQSGTPPGQPIPAMSTPPQARPPRHRVSLHAPSGNTNTILHRLPATRAHPSCPGGKENKRPRPVSSPASSNSTDDDADIRIITRPQTRVRHGEAPENPGASL
jgi:hypothetical protein